MITKMLTGFEYTEKNIQLAEQVKNELNLAVVIVEDMREKIAYAVGSEEDIQKLFEVCNERKEQDKVLYFEGAGCVPRGDVENCRIRTSFVNDEGVQIYLELSGFEVGKRSGEKFKGLINASTIDYCYEVTADGEKYRADIGFKSFEYSKASILEFVNENLHCSFTEIKILDIFDGYHVHKDGGGYNRIEDYTYNEKRANAARTAFNKVDMEIREKLHETYSKISLLSIEDDGITVRCYASNALMTAFGMDPQQRVFKVLFEEVQQ